MSAALKIAIIVTALCALAGAETKVEKEKRLSDKDPAPLQVIQQQQKQPQAISQQTYQLVYPQATTKLSPSSPNNQYSQQQLQYIFQQAVLPQLQKQALGTPFVTQQYVIPQQHQFQYIPIPHQSFLEQPQKKGAVANGQAVQQIQAQVPQAHLGGQYYLHPSQLAAAYGAQYHHPAAPYYFLPQHHAQQYYVPHGHPAMAAANQAFYFGGFPANYQPFLGNQQYYFPHHHPQQILAQNVKGVEARGKDAYVLPQEGIHQLQQYSTLPEALVQGNGGLRVGHPSPAVQTQQRESPTLTLSGKFGSKTNPERQQG